MSQQGLRRRVQELAEACDYVLKRDSDEAVVPNPTDAADLRALLAAHAKAKRENAAMRHEWRDLCEYATNEDLNGWVNYATLRMHLKRMKAKGITL